MLNSEEGLRDYQIDIVDRIRATWPSGVSLSYGLRNQRMGHIMRGAGKLVEHTPHDGSPLLRFDVRCAVVDALSTAPTDWRSAPVLLPPWELFK
jgi:hypothetical protein